MRWQTLFQVFVAASAIWAATMKSEAEEVRPEVARDCAQKWGSDYRMQVYCRDTQMEAYNKLGYKSAASLDASMVQGVEAANRVYKKKGIVGLNAAVDKCYRVASSISNLRYCIGLDAFASMKNQSGRNTTKATVSRVIDNMNAQYFSGIDELKDNWIPQVFAAYRHVRDGS